MLEYVDEPTSLVKYLAEAEALRNSPGRWAKVITAPTPSAAWCHQHAITSGRRAAFRPKGSFEATARGCDVLVRYVGDTPTH